ncbi:MAG: hypothetical protein AAFX54_15685 [Pseudomonadota bacterium]
MSSKMLLGLSFFLIVCSGCVSIEYDEQFLEVDGATTEIIGWFGKNAYELAIFPIRNIGSYQRFDREENEKCVTLIFPKGAHPVDSNRFKGRRVSVKGYSRKYDDLESGDPVHDQLLSKKYFNDTLVENYCYRDYIFIVKDIRPLKR